MPTAHSIRFIFVIVSLTVSPAGPHSANNSCFSALLKLLSIVFISEISTKEGTRALFKGLGPTLVGVVPARSINFYTYGNGKVILADKFNDGKQNAAVHLVAAAFAGESLDY